MARCSKFFTNQGGLRNHLRAHRRLPCFRQQQRNLVNGLNEPAHGENDEAPFDDLFPPSPPGTPVRENEAPALETVEIHPFINGSYFL